MRLEDVEDVTKTQFNNASSTRLLEEKKRREEEELRLTEEERHRKQRKEEERLLQEKKEEAEAERALQTITDETGTKEDFTQQNGNLYGTQFKIGTSGPGGMG